MWKLVTEKNPGVVLNTVLPNLNMGAILSDEQYASTGAAVITIYETGEVEDVAKTNPLQRMVNVQDMARVHVVALIDPDVKNQRILGLCTLVQLQ